MAGAGRVRGILEERGGVGKCFVDGRKHVTKPRTQTVKANNGNVYYNSAPEGAFTFIAQQMVLKQRCGQGNDGHQ